MNGAIVAARKRELVERCAEQRVGLAYELKALQRPPGELPPLVAPLVPPFVARLVPVIAAQVAAHRRLAYGAAGAALAFAVVRPARMRRLAGLAARGWGFARHALTVAARLRA